MESMFDMLEDSRSASKAQVRASPISGNGLFATTSMKEGELVLTVDRPLVGVLDIPRLEDSCSNCFLWTVGDVDGSIGYVDMGVPRRTVNACVGCKRVKYCSKKCQSQAWKREHKHICKFLKNCPPLPSAVRAARELAVIMNNSTTSEKTKQDINRMEKHTLSTISSQVEHSDRHNERNFKVAIQATKDILAMEMPDFLEEHNISEDYVGKIWRNSLTLVTPAFDPLGLAFDPILCSANHSCAPNVVIVMDGASISIRTLEPIAKDAELFISYIDSTDPFSVRQFELSSRYSFTCSCKKCALGPTASPENDWLRPASQLPSGMHSLRGVPLIESPFASDPRYTVVALPSSSSSSSPQTSNADLRRLSALQGIAYKNLDATRGLAITNSGAAQTSLMTMLGILSGSGMFPYYRQPFAAIRADLLTSSLADRDWRSALGMMIRIHFDIDPVLYPQPFHPVRIVHTWALTKLLLYLYSERDDPVTTEMVRQDFDFVVVIWKLLHDELVPYVGMSHGTSSRFSLLVVMMASDVRRDIGEENLNLCLQDPYGMWDRFRNYADLVKV